MDISFNSAGGDDRRRLRTYQGELTILPPSPASCALVEFAREQIEAAFVPRHPQHAHEELAVTETVEILTRLKPQFIHDRRTRDRLQCLLVDVGCDPHLTFQDVPRLRVAYPADYLTTGIAYAHHPHRDTWYSAPPCQLNWWMPIYDFDANQGMAFHPRYWGASIKNSSADFNYYRWNADGRKNAAQHVKSDTRVQPRAEETLELEPGVRLVVPAGGIIVFSAAHLHSTVRNETSLARWSIDFRTVNVDDLANRRGPATSDSASAGTSLRDFRRVVDFAPMPDEIVAMYDDTPVSEGVAVFAPDSNRDENTQSGIERTKTRTYVPAAPYLATHTHAEGTMERGLLVELSSDERTTLLRIANGDDSSDTLSQAHVTHLLSLALIEEQGPFVGLTALGKQRVEWLGGGSERSAAQAQVPT
jgi:hypothetical protein